MYGLPLGNLLCRWRPLRRLFVLLVGLVGLAASAIPASPVAHASGATPILVNKPTWSDSAGFGSTAPAWVKDARGIVHLQGAAKQVLSTSSDPTACSGGGNANLLGTLPTGPSGANPNRTVFTIVHTFNGTYADLGIQADGQICLIAPRPPAVKDYSFVSLESISFFAGTGTSLTNNVNTTNWSTSAGFGSVAPASAGTGQVVHLQGAVKQKPSTGGDPNLILTLPSGLIPCKNIYAIVHTFNGTYADVGVQSNGQVRLVAPRSPAVTDFSFVSLESISYQPCGFDSNIAVNGNNWSGNAGYSSWNPGWLKDVDGFVHLQGAATQKPGGTNNNPQACNGSGSANLLGTLPAGFSEPSPSNRTVYTIVHTFDGTYADVGITPKGEICLIAPRPPAVKDYSFVSLEGINYQP